MQPPYAILRLSQPESGPRQGNSFLEVPKATAPERAADIGYSLDRNVTDFRRPGGFHRL